jgi:hypothetical protein
MGTAGSSPVGRPPSIPPVGASRAIWRAYVAAKDLEGRLEVAGVASEAHTVRCVRAGLFARLAELGRDRGRRASGPGARQDAR